MCIYLFIHMCLFDFYLLLIIVASQVRDPIANINNSRGGPISHTVTHRQSATACNKGRTQAITLFTITTLMLLSRAK